MKNIVTQDRQSQKFGHGRRSDHVNFVFGGNEYRVYAGPFIETDPTDSTVCLAEELAHIEHTLLIPIKDFSIPNHDLMQVKLIQLLMLMLSSQKVSIGCMGGIGRTGLVLSLLKKVELELSGNPSSLDPVAIIRETYDTRAVETQSQKEFIENFEVGEAVKWLEATLPTLKPRKLEVEAQNSSNLPLWKKWLSFIGLNGGLQTQ